MLKVVLTAVGILLLFSGGLLFAEGRRRWMLAGVFGVVAALCLLIGKGTPWVILAVVAGLAAAYLATRPAPVRGGK